MQAYIKAIAYYLPEKTLSNEDLNQQFPEWSVDKIAEKTGICNRHIAAEHETSGDMAIKAAERLFEEHQIDKSSIDYVILCTQSPDYFLPTTACLIQEALGLNTNIGAFDMNLGCSGFVYALGLAKGLVATGQAKNVLLLTAETYSKYIYDLDKSNRTIFGDAAAATLVSEDGFAEILDFEYGTDGKGAKNLIVKNGAFRAPAAKAKHEISTDEYQNYISDDHLYMNGTEIFIFTLSAVPKLVKQTLLKNKLSPEDIGCYVFHQANQYMLQSIQKKIKIPDGKFYIHLANCGNTVSSTIPIALYHAQRDQSLATKQQVLLAGFGVGYSWAGTVLKIK
jgi:3-oxoacyl-[acyl-carrier-protein] synthase III